MLSLEPQLKSAFNSGARYPYRKEKETYELIFLWLSWLVVLLAGAGAQQRRRQ